MLLELMRRDRNYSDDAARQTLVKIFELLGDDTRASSADTNRRLVELREKRRAEIAVALSLVPSTLNNVEGHPGIERQ